MPVQAGLIPSRLADYAEHHDEETFDEHEWYWNVWNVVPVVMSVRQRRQLKQAIGSMRKIASGESQKEKIRREEEVNKSE